jgi:hypothetical protein
MTLFVEQACPAGREKGKKILKILPALLNAERI